MALYLYLQTQPFDVRFLFVTHEDACRKDILLFQLTEQVFTLDQYSEKVHDEHEKVFAHNLWYSPMKL